MKPVVMVALVFIGTASAQEPAFDVASVRSMPDGQGFPFAQIGLQPGGRVVAVNVTLRLLVRFAYQIEDYQLLNAPDWIGRTRYEVNALAGREVSRVEALAMLRSMLAERFALRVHSESRQLPTYHLFVARADQLGERMRRSGSECAPVVLPTGVPPPPPPPAGAPVTTSLAPGRSFECPSVFFPGWVSGRRVTMMQFAERMAVILGRPVIDRTGLRESFDLDLIYSSDQGFVAAPPPGAPPPPGLNPADAPQLVTAIREQLGLRLEATRGPVDVLVIDSVQAPTEN
jgi:uncharacterized protein (TIGR03435 family)